MARKGIPRVFLWPGSGAYDGRAHRLTVVQAVDSRSRTQHLGFRGFRNGCGPGYDRASGTGFRVQGLTFAGSNLRGRDQDLESRTSASGLGFRCWVLDLQHPVRLLQEKT